MWRSGLGEWEEPGRMGKRAYLISTPRTLSFNTWSQESRTGSLCVPPRRRGEAIVEERADRRGLLSLKA